LTCAVLFGMLQSATDAFAQTPLVQDSAAASNPYASRLERTIGGRRPRRCGATRPRKSRQALSGRQTKQQAELDRVTQQAKRMGLRSSASSPLFNGHRRNAGR